MKCNDRLKSLEKCSQKASTIADVVKLGGNWPKLWDAALHLGTRHLRGLQTLSRLMSHHGRGSKPCPLCEKDKLCSRLLDHYLTAHQQKIGLQGIGSILSVQRYNQSKMVPCLEMGREADSS